MRPRLIAMLVVLSSLACTHVDPGHVGVEFSSCSGGGISEKPLGIGYYMTGACTSIVEFPIYQQTMVLTKAANEGSPNDDSINVTDSAGLPISVDAALNFTVDPDKTPHIFTKFRKDLDHIQTSYMRQTIRQALQDVFAEYTAQQLYSDKKEKSRAEVQKILMDKLAPDGFQVTQFTINETRVPKSVRDAIESKVAMTQQAQQAEQAVRKATAEGLQRIATAEAEAQSIRVKADAEAYANQKIASSLSPALVHYRLAGKWDGKMPTYTGSGANFLFQDEKVK